MGQRGVGEPTLHLRTYDTICSGTCAISVLQLAGNGQIPQPATPRLTGAPPIQADAACDALSVIVGTTPEVQTATGGRLRIGQVQGVQHRR